MLPDRFLQAEPLAKLIEAERPTLMACVPTIFADLLRYADEHHDVDLSSLTNAICGGVGRAQAARCRPSRSVMACASSRPGA